MKVLGINISHNPSICLYDNGKVIDFYNEERFTLIKNDLPTNETEIYQSILHNINFKFDIVCYTSFGRNVGYSDSTDQAIINNLQKQLGNPNYFFNEKEHHLYHAVSAYYFSNFDEAAAIVVDGGGACKFYIPYQEVESIYFINKKNITPFYKHSSNYRASKVFDIPNNKKLTYLNGFLNKFSNECVGGHAFEEATFKAGFDHSNDAGKLMGLSSYAYTDKKYDVDYKKVNIGKEIQEKTFYETCSLIDQVKDKTNNILLSGGYFLNCSNNFKYVKKYPKLNFFVDPIPHDAGTAIGVAIYYDIYR